MAYEFEVAIQFDYVKGLLPVFTHTNGSNPFAIDEWPEVRASLREEVLEDVPQEYEAYLNSERVGERYSYTIGSVLVEEDAGELLEKKYDASLSSLQDAFDSE